MKTLIIYSGKHGTTARIANMLKEGIDGEVSVCDIAQVQDIEGYDGIILGSSVYAGQVSKRFKQFTETNLPILKKKKLGLYLCCMKRGDEAKEQFNNAFLPELRDCAAVEGFLGGEFDFAKMNFIERFLVKKIAKVKESVSDISETEIENFVKKWNDNLE